MVDRTLEHHLNRLIKIAKNGELSYKKDLNYLDDEATQSAFRRYAIERAQFVEELQGLVRVVGGDPADHATVEDGLSRVIRELEVSISDADDRFILGLFVDGLKRALEAYEDILQAQLPPPANQIIPEQHTAYQRTLAEIQQMLGQ